MWKLWVADSQKRLLKHCITILFLDVPLFTQATVTDFDQRWAAKTTAKTSFSLM